jgi:DNA-binding transcriptional LysR family regulator
MAHAGDETGRVILRRREAGHPADRARARVPGPEERPVLQRGDGLGRDTRENAVGLRRAHHFDGRHLAEITQLRDEVFISGTSDDPNRVALASACAGAGFTPRVAFETADYAATASLVRHGFAIAVVPRLAWPADNRGVARLSLRGPGGGILARRILLAQRTGRTPALVAELRRHLIRSWPQRVDLPSGD